MLSIPQNYCMSWRNVTSQASEGAFTLSIIYRLRLDSYQLVILMRTLTGYSPVYPGV